MSPSSAAAAAASRRRLLIGFAAAIIIAFAVYPHGYPQDPAYHHFADTRSWWAIPNTLNVLSNIAFLLALRRPRRSATEVVFFLGVFMTAFGSAYYHLNPSNATLPWDRLGMAIAFMALLAILTRAPLSLFVALEAFGIASVIVSGVYDDLRLYGVAQYFPILVLLVMIEGWLWAAGAAYAAAKACELLDAWVYAQTHHVVSGHTLKHLFAGLGIYFIWRWLRSRPEDPRGRSPRAGTSPAPAAGAPR